MQRGVGRGLAATKPAWLTNGTLGSLRNETDHGRHSDAEQSKRESPGRGGDRVKRRRSPSHSSGSGSSRDMRRGRDGKGNGAGAGGSHRRPSRSRDRSSNSRSRSRSGSRGRKRTRSRDGRARGGASARGGGGTGLDGRDSRGGDLGGTATNRAVVEAALKERRSNSGVGRGRGSTLPAWLTQGGGGLPGGLQQLGDSKGNDSGAGQPSPAARPAGRSAIASKVEPSEGREEFGKGYGRNGERSGRGRRRGDAGRPPEPLPALNSIHRGEVVKIESFGAFVKMEGFRKHGLVHCSQMANYRVEDVTDICRMGDVVYVKVIDTTEGADGRDKRISLSMKLVEQSTGKDLDPSNAEADCGVQGHMSMSCFARNGEKYDLVKEDDGKPGHLHDSKNGGGRGGGRGGGGGMRGVRRESNLPGVLAGGRGRGATLPAWMTEQRLDEKSSKKGHRKEKKERKERKGKRKRKSDRRRDESDDSKSDSDHEPRPKKKKHKKNKQKHGGSSRRHRSSVSSSSESNVSGREGKGAGRDEERPGGSLSRGDGRDNRDWGKKQHSRTGGGSRSRSNSVGGGRERGTMGSGQGRRDDRTNGGGTGRYGRFEDNTRNGSSAGYGAAGAWKKNGGGVFRNGDDNRGRGPADPIGDRWNPRGDSERSESRSTR